MSDTLRIDMLEPHTNDTLPEGWREAALSDVSEIRVSNVDKKTNLGEIPVRLCNYLEVYKNQYITADLPFMDATAAPSEIGQFAVEVGDVMITKDSETPDDIGVSAVALWSEPRLVCGYHLALIKPDKSQVDPVFLAKQLRLPRIAAYYGRLACGSTRYGLSHSGIAKTPLKLPSLPQQAKISRILMTLDSLIERTEALIAKCQGIKQGMMHDLFTRGVDEHAHLRPSYAEAPDLYKPSELGWIPKEWEYDSVESVLERIIDYRGRTPIKTDNGIPLITAKNVRMGFIDEEPKEFISEASFDSWMTRGIPAKGDVLFTTEAPLGNVAQIESEHRMAFAQRIIILQTNKRMQSGFLKNLLMTDWVQRWIHTKGSGSTVEGIKQSVFRQAPLAFPSTTKEQQAIVERLDSLAKLSNRELESLLKFRFENTGLMQDLLTGKVRVKVDEAEEVAAHA